MHLKQLLIYYDESLRKTRSGTNESFRSAIVYTIWILSTAPFKQKLCRFFKRNRWSNKLRCMKPPREMIALLGLPPSLLFSTNRVKSCNRYISRGWRFGKPIKRTCEKKANFQFSASIQLSITGLMTFVTEQTASFLFWPLDPKSCSEVTIINQRITTSLQWYLNDCQQFCNWKATMKLLPPRCRSSRGVNAFDCVFMVIMISWTMKVLYGMKPCWYFLST